MRSIDKIAMTIETNDTVAPAAALGHTKLGCQATLFEPNQTQAITKSSDVHAAKHHFALTLSEGVLVSKPNQSQVEAIIAQTLASLAAKRGVDAQAGKQADRQDTAAPAVSCVLKAERPIFSHISAEKATQYGNAGFLMIAGVNQELALALAQAVAASFKVVELYEKHECCPYCQSTGDAIIKLEPVTMNLEPGATTNLNIRIKEEPALCTKCGLGFNYSGHSQDMVDALNSSDEVTSFNSPAQQNSQGMATFATCLDTVSRYVQSKDSFIVEVGSYDGYFIKKLQERGYTNILGFEPGNRFDPSLPINKNYFDLTHAESQIGKSQVDLLVSVNTIESIFHIGSFMSAVNYALKDNGLALFQVPNPIFISNFQVFRMPVAFLERLCHDHNMVIEEVIPAQKPYALNLFTAIVARKLADSEVQALAQTGKALPSIFASEEERQANIKEVLIYGARRTFSPTRLKDLAKQIQVCEQSKSKVVVYGSGITTNKILAGLTELGYGFDYSKWTFVDSNPTKEGFTIYAPEGQELKLHYAGTKLQDQQVGLVIFAVQSKSFLSEMQSFLSKINCQYTDSFYHNVLED